MPSEPKRIQRRRTKGWRMPEGAVYVGRPTKWGNPFVMTQGLPMAAEVAVACFESLLRDSGGEWFSVPLPWPKGKIPAEITTTADVIADLRGKDLACWCPLDSPCHADVLLRIANGLTATRTSAARDAT